MLFKREASGGVHVDSDDSILDYESVASTPPKHDNISGTAGPSTLPLKFPPDDNFEEALSNYDISMNEASNEMVSDSSDDRSSTGTERGVGYFIPKSGSEPSLSSACSTIDPRDTTDDQQTDSSVPESEAGMPDSV